VRLEISADLPMLDPLTRKMSSRHMDARRVVLRADQDTACGYDPAFADGYMAPPDTIHRTTAITFSRQMLAALKTRQHAHLLLYANEFGNPEANSAFWLHRLEAAPVMLPVLLEDQRVSLPAVHAQCDSVTYYTNDENKQLISYKAMPCEYYVLDDPANPLMLMWRTMQMAYGRDSSGKLGRRFVNGVWQIDTTQLQVVRVAYVAQDSTSRAAAEKQMGEALAQHRKVVVYGIYFDFAKTDIKPESQPVLRELADLLHQNPTWTLAINGHTDSVGGPAYNLDLSNRRAVAVKNELVTKYDIAAARLTTAGFGASVPIESNATLEGRARNRRVELVRED
jgi:outer membrane protein OmpA-like peptidoglycan-associated protein